MEPVTDALLGRMVQAIVDEVDPEQIILFGSRGRGDERENSDVDLIVVEAEPFGLERSRHKELVRLYHALARFHVPADARSSALRRRSRSRAAVVSSRSAFITGALHWRGGRGGGRRGRCRAGFDGHHPRHPGRGPRDADSRIPGRDVGGADPGAHASPIRASCRPAGVRHGGGAADRRGRERRRRFGRTARRCRREAGRTRPA